MGERNNTRVLPTIFLSMGIMMLGSVIGEGKSVAGKTSPLAEEGDERSLGARRGSFMLTTAPEEPTLAQRSRDSIRQLRRQRTQWSLLAETYEAHEERLPLPEVTREGEGGRIIATFEGGGIRGLALAREVQLLSQEASLDVVKLFDATGGTSVGAILAGGIASGKYSGGELVDLLRLNGKHIFSSSVGRRLTSFGVLVKPRYDRSHLDRLLNDQLGEIMMAETRIPFAAVAVGQKIGRHGALGRPEPLTFRTFDAQRDEKKNIPLSVALAASSAAPGYFAAPHFAYDGLEWQGMDGGLIANAPDLETLLHAAQFYGELHKDDVVLSFTTGTQTTEHSPPGIFSRLVHAINPFTRGGLLEQASSVFEAFLDGQTARSHANTRHMLSIYGLEHFYEMDFPISKRELDNTSTEYLEELYDNATYAFYDNWTRQNEEIVELIKRRADRRDA